MRRFLHGLTPPLSREKFAGKLLDRLRAVRPEPEANYEAEEFRLVQGTTIINLANLYEAYAHAPRWRRWNVLQDLLSLGFLNSSFADNWAEARLQVLPKVRERAFFWNIDDPLVPYPCELGPDLQAVLVLDLPESCMYLQARQLEDWGIPIAEAVRVARDNLWARSQERFQEIRPGLHLSPWLDSHAACRLVLGRLLEELAVRGDRLVVAPHRDLVLVGGSEDEELLFAVLEGQLEVPYQLSPRPLRWVGEGWLPYEPRLPAWRALLDSVEAGFYNEQVEYLNRTLTEDVGVMSVQCIRRGGAGTRVTTWAHECVCLLPRADWVLLDRGDGDPRCYAWSEFLTRFTTSVRPEPGIVPPRWRTARTPTEAEVESAAWVGVDDLLPP
ncbi:MAG: hypothetical protein KF760_34050 [Candidatus Eremiobacteraeota bacterium]|nr:hypothetical protein [Candidatus Eremiobacteraeota bacterium]MCW5869351.1 hypothetical protein [Candidatus Eremiobacteraeota bacterium]